MSDQTTKKPVRHLLGLSGGKDSSALAIYMRDRVPEMEYFFADTGAELPETLAFVDLLQDYLGKKIKRLDAKRSFEWHLKLNGNFLPTTKSRWCTSELKIRPFEEWVGEDEAITYVAIRGDEAYRHGYISTKSNISARYPFIEDGKTKEDIIEILDSTGLGLPKYYEWRSRSGCYFCFFQRKEEWLGLAERHPELFQKAREYEEFHRGEGRMQTWSQGEYLDELLARGDLIRANAAMQREAEKQMPKKRLIEQSLESCSDDDACLMCLK